VTTTTSRYHVPGITQEQALQTISIRTSHEPRERLHAAGRPHHLTLYLYHQTHQHQQWSSKTPTSGAASAQPCTKTTSPKTTRTSNTRTSTPPQHLQPPCRHRRNANYSCRRLPFSRAREWCRCHHLPYAGSKSGKPRSRPRGEEVQWR
jgi:hypothetical protein